MKLITILMVPMHLFIVQIASALELTSDTDLKAAYCVGVRNSLSKLEGDLNSLIDKVAYETQLPSEKRQAMKQKNADRQFELERPRKYLMHRLASATLDATGIIFAIQSGQNDFERMGRTNAECVESCGGNSKSPVTMSIVGKCVMACMYSSIPGQRVKSCDDLTWLPY